MKIVAQDSQYHRFRLYFDYSPDIITFCRILKDSFGWKRFSFTSYKEEKFWVFSETVFLKVLVEKFPDIEIEPQVMEIWKKEDSEINQEKERENEINLIKQKKDTKFEVKGIKENLYPYQKVGIEFLIASGGKAIIADPPGLGKTSQTLGYITHLDIKKALVVCPATIKSSWENEILKWTDLSYIIINSKTKIEEIPEDTRIWIINYDILKKSLEILLKINFNLVVFDESHFLKNNSSQRCRAARHLTRNISKVIHLTGTPLLSRPIEMFTLLNMIDPQLWNNYYNYSRYFCGGKQTRWGWDSSGATHTEELHNRIKKYFIRRSKEEVLKFLPPKNRIDVPVRLENNILKEYEAAEDDLFRYLKTYKGKQPSEIARIIAAEKLAKLTILRQLVSLGKIDTAEEIINSILESEEKILVFASFIKPLNILFEKFKNISVMLTGMTPIEERGEIVKEFQNNPNIKIFFGGLKSAGLGITLTAAQNVLFLDYSFVPADHKQAEDRVHRHGQKASSINIYQLFAKETIDEKLKKILERKQKIFDQVIEGKTIEKQKKEDIIKEVFNDIIERKEDKWEPMQLRRNQ